MGKVVLDSDIKFYKNSESFSAIKENNSNIIIEGIKHIVAKFSTHFPDENGDITLDLSTCLNFHIIASNVINNIYFVNNSIGQVGKIILTNAVTLSHNPIYISTPPAYWMKGETPIITSVINEYDIFNYQCTANNLLLDFLTTRP
tara:strand:- start:1490 stop:1924 length:435 start_codon:yes stop_codon:yes gene_type:complete